VEQSMLRCACVEEKYVVVVVVCVVVVVVAVVVVVVVVVVVIVIFPLQTRFSTLSSALSAGQMFSCACCY
jgi:flagellar biosynthesis protein FlhB